MSILYLYWTGEFCLAPSLVKGQVWHKYCQDFEGRKLITNIATFKNPLYQQLVHSSLYCGGRHSRGHVPASISRSLLARAGPLPVQEPPASWWGRGPPGRTSPGSWPEEQRPAELRGEAEVVVVVAAPEPRQHLAVVRGMVPHHVEHPSCCRTHLEPPEHAMLELGVEVPQPGQLPRVAEVQ